MNECDRLNYSEHQPPPELACAVRVAWSLTIPADVGPVAHSALPDGCIEVIARECGQSHWLRDQPRNFVVGLIDRPAQLQFSAGASFTGLRLWPWAWTWLSGAPLVLRNDWQPLAEADLSADARGVLSRPWAGSWEALESLLGKSIDARDRQIATAALCNEQTAQMAREAGISARSCQRWFVRCAGITPRSFRRLRRFEQGLRALEGSSASLAEHAQRAGFADQAHMAREFRRYAEQPAHDLRKRLRGPFLAKSTE